MGEVALAPFRSQQKVRVRLVANLLLPCWSRRLFCAVASKSLGRTGMQPEHVYQLAVLVAGEARKRFSAAA